MKRSIITLALSLLPFAFSFAQREMVDVIKGNYHYNKEGYTKAEIDYRRGLEENKNSYEAHYNLGDALYKQDKFQDALEQFETASNITSVTVTMRCSSTEMRCRRIRSRYARTLRMMTRVITW